MKSEEKKKDPNRGKGGLFLPNNTMNISGENGLKGLPSYIKTCQFFLDNYSQEELESLVKDKERMGKMSVFHAQIITHLVASLVNGKERERMYDRMWGKPVQTIVLPERKKPLPDDVNNITDDEAESVHEQLLSE